MKPFVIVNPTAGSVTNSDLLKRLLQRLRPGQIKFTRRSGDAERFARDAAGSGSDPIVGAGGDGTLNGIVNGIIQSGREHEVRLGIIPLGTGNDFARLLGLNGTIEQNIDILLAGKTTPIDAVRVRGRRTRYFVNISAGGFSGVVNEKLTPEIKRAWGPLAYLRGAAAAFPELQAYGTTVVIDDAEQLSAELYNVIVANGQFVGGGLPIAPQADPGDGLIDVILIPKLPGGEMALMMAEILLGKHLGRVMVRRCKTVSVKSTPGMWFNIDGELAGNEPMSFEVIPNALHFVTG